jgi:hypothetical protein
MPFCYVFSISQLHMTEKHISYIQYIASVISVSDQADNSYYIDYIIYFVFIYFHMSIYFFVPRIFPFIITYSLWITAYLHKCFLPGWCNEI